jgi:DNA-binding Lrp family transcriptional regulator
MQTTARWKSVHRQAEYRRLKKKTREYEFVNRLENEFEFSPRISRGVLEVVEEMFFDNREIETTQTEYTCVSAEEGPGRVMEELKKVRVKLTKEQESDQEIQQRQGESAKRRVQILRMSEEAYDQGGLLTQEDLGRMLGVSSRTVRRDVEKLMQKKVKLYLRGLQQDIGKGISHKVWIVGLYLQWKTYSEIERITGHSSAAVKNYLNDFSRVLMARERGIKSAKEIGFYIGRTERLVNEYLELIAKAEKDTQQRKRIESITTQMRHLERKTAEKKGDSTMVWRLV